MTRYRLAPRATVLALVGILAAVPAGSTPQELDRTLPAREWEIGRLEETPPPRMSGSRLPVPPHQHDLWRRPRGETLGAVAAAVSEFFRSGAADPRGCEYRTVLAAGRQFFHYREELPLARGWVLPARPGKQRFAIFWDGLLHPIAEVRGRVDLAADVEVMLPSHSERRRPATGLGTSPGNRVTSTFLLLRLGKPKLSRQVLPEAFTGGSVPRLLFTALGELKRHTESRALWEHMGGDDRLCRLRLAQASGLQTRLLRMGRQLRLIDDRSDNIAYVVLGLRTPEWFEPLLADQRRRSREQRIPEPLVKIRSIQEPPRRIAALIQTLDQLDTQALTEDPAHPELREDPIIRALVREGKSAVPPLIACIDRDRRLTRSVGDWRWGMAGRLVPVSEAAWTALTEIVGSPELFELRERVRDQHPGFTEDAFQHELAEALSQYWRHNGSDKGRPGGSS